MEHYRREGLAAVHGWFEPESAEVMALLLEHQVAVGPHGGVAEIGVHHGRSFLLLANGLAPGESGVALDVFERQEDNQDGSGRGDRERFEDNLRRWAPDADVTVVSRSSLEVSSEEAPDVFGAVRMFSVDGGHTAAITRHDLELAEACVVEGGVVVLDDLLNGHWLGVLTGAAAYLLDRPRLAPFACSPNKLYLTDSADAATAYAAHLRQAVPDLLGKRDVEFFGTTVDVYGQGAPRHRAPAAASSATASAAGGGHRDLERLLRRERAARRAAERDVVALEERLAAVEGSTAWRLTGPARWAAGVIGARVRVPGREG
jgi:predicted O-methyltransferase YrrM